MSYDQWYGLSESGNINPKNDDQNLFQAGVMYWFNDDQNLGVGFSYLNGSNPRQGKPLQEYWQFSVRAKL